MGKKMTWAVRTPQICLGFVLLVIGYVMFAMTNFSVFDGVFRNIAERVFAKHLAQDLKGAKDSTSILVPDVKHGGSPPIVSINTS